MSNSSLECIAKQNKFQIIYPDHRILAHRTVQIPQKYKLQLDPWASATEPPPPVSPLAGSPSRLPAIAAAPATAPSPPHSSFPLLRRAIAPPTRGDSRQCLSSRRPDQTRGGGAVEGTVETWATVPSRLPPHSPRVPCPHGVGDHSAKTRAKFSSGRDASGRGQVTGWGNLKNPSPALDPSRCLAISRSGRMHLTSRSRLESQVAIGGSSCAGQHFGFTVASIPMLFPPSGAAAAWKVARWWPRGNPLMRGRRHGDIRCWSVLFLTKVHLLWPCCSWLLSDCVSVVASSTVVASLQPAWRSLVSCRRSKLDQPD